MKKVRLNDKMWFGKYKNMRMSDVLIRDRMYIESLRDQKLIEYDDNILEFLSENEKIRDIKRYSQPQEVFTARIVPPRMDHLEQELDEPMTTEEPMTITINETDNVIFSYDVHTADGLPPFQTTSAPAWYYGESSTTNQASE